MLRMTLIFLTLVSFLTVNSVFSLEDKPTMVVEVFRHGARTLIHHVEDYFVFSDPESLLPTGQRQQYNLGKLLAKKYPHLLESTDPKYIYARSSEPVRCTMSLEAQMFGVFEGKIPNISATAPLEATLPLFHDESLVDEIASELSNNLEAIPNGFMPFTYETRSILEEEMLHVAPWNCDYVMQRQKERVKDNASQEILAFLAETISKLRAKGYPINSMEHIANFGEALFTMHFQGRDAELPEDLKYQSLIYNDTKFANEWYSTYYFVGAQLERSIKMIHLMEQIIDWFEGVANGTNTLKFSFMSGHETSYLALLNSYGIYNDSCLFENYKAKRSEKDLPYPECIFPEYSSQIIYEIYNETGDPYVKFLYNGKPLKICSQSVGAECKLDDFISETRSIFMNLTRQDAQEYCTFGHKLSKVNITGTLLWPSLEPNLYMRFLLLLILGFIVVALSYKLTRGKKAEILMTKVKKNPITLI